MENLNIFFRQLSARFKSLTQQKTIFLFSLFFTALMAAGVSLRAQSAGDYRSNAASMSWSSVAGWQKYNGSTWNAATDYPGQNTCSGCTVTIRDAHTVTLDLSPANSVGAIVIGNGTSGTLTLGSFTLTDAGNLTVNSNAALNLNTGNFTVNGSTTSAGTVTDASNTGINTFTGLVTKTGGSWTSTAVTSTSAMIFTGGITNSAGSFNAGAATIGNGTTITAAAAMSFNNNFTANGALSITGTGGLTITGSNITAAVMGNLSILASSSLTYSGSSAAVLTTAGNLSIASGATLALTSTGNLSIAGTTTINGTFSDNTDNGINTFTGLITNNGTFNTSAVSNGNNIRIDGGISNTMTANFSVTSVRLGGSVNTVQPVNIPGSLQTGGIATTFASGTVSVTGTGNVNFSNLTVNSGATLNIFTAGLLTVTGTATIAGSFTDNDAGSISVFGGLLTVTGTFDVSALGISTLFINGGLTYTSGIFNCSSATLQSNSTTITNNGALNFSNGVNITGGASITFAGPGTVTVGGAVNVNFPVSLFVSGPLVFANTGSVTVAAVTTISSGGSITDNENTGTTTFTGAFNSSGNADFTGLSTSHLVFNGGVAHLAGTFNMTTATISTDPVYNDIDVTSPLNLSGGVTFTGTGTLMVVGAGGLTFSGTANIFIPAGLLLGTLSSITVSTTGNFTVSGTSSLGGSFTDSDNTGITSFGGLITKTNGAWISTAVTTPSNMVFTAGFTQTGGTFVAGAASMPTGQTLNSNPGPVMYFNNPLVIGGAGDITISGTGGVNLGGSAVNYSIPGNLTLTGTLTLSTTGNFSVAGAVAITGSGAFTDNNNTGISSFEGLVTHNSTGAWTSTAVTTAANMQFLSGFTNTAGTFSGGAATVGDNQTLTGTVNMSFVNGIIVQGNADLNIAGTSATGVSFGGTLVNYAVRNLNISGLLTASTSGNLTVAGATALTGSGGFLDNNNTGITSFTGLVSLGSAASFTSTAVTTVNNLLFAGGITQNNTTAGAFSAGTLRTTASQSWSGAGDISTTGVLDVSTGTLTNNITGTVMAGGTLTGNSFIQGINARLSLGSTTPLTITTLVSTSTGNTVDYHSAGAATMRAQTYYNLTVSGSGNKTIPNADLTINGNLTITAGVLYNTTNNRNILLGGNWINNAGTAGFAAGTGTVIFNGTAVQTLGGSAATTFNNFTVNNGNGISQFVNSTITGILNFTTGIINTGSNKVIISSTGTVTRTSGHINGFEQKYVSNGAAVSRTFEIGDANIYSPATVVFATVSTAGNLTMSATAGDHAEIDYSGLDSSKSVNRYWSLVNTGIVFPTANATFNWVAADQDAGAIASNLKTAVYNGTAWSLTNSVAAVSTSIQATGLTSFGDYVAGEGVSNYKWTGAAMTDNWHTAKNWHGGVPTTAFNTLIPSGLTGGLVYPAISSDTAKVNNITVQSGASLTVGAGELQISGAVSNAGIINAAGGTVTFNGPIPQTVPAATFAGNTVKNLYIKNDLSLSGTTVLTGTLTLENAKTLVTNDYLILRSNASGTARIAALPVNAAGSATAWITGKVTVERYFPLRKAWRLLSAPVKPATAPSINAAWQEGLTTASPNPNLYPGYGVFITGGTVANGFDQGPTPNSSIKIFNSATNSFTVLPGTGTYTRITDYPGYFVYIRGDRGINLMAGAAAAVTPTTLRIKGEINTGNQLFSVNGTGYTLLGNPFTSAIDFETLSKSNVKNAFYVWDPQLAGSYGLGGYVSFIWNNSTGSYDATSAAGPISKYIQSGAAILIQSADGVNPGSIKVKESDKTSNGSDYVFSRSSNSGQSLRVNLYTAGADTSLIDGVLTTYDDGNSNSIDNDDAKKLNGSGENICINRDSTTLAIERRKTINTADTSFLKISQMKQQPYKLVIATQNLPANMTVLLKDNYSGSINNTLININGETAVYFSVNADATSRAANRFSIVFAPNAVLLVSFKTVQAWREEERVMVKWITENELNISSYEVQRSTNGRDFITVHTVPAAGSGSYLYTDAKPVAGLNYYRIRSVSPDGQAHLSRTVAIDFSVLGNTPAVKVCSNPVSGNNITLKCSNLVSGNYILQLYDAIGKLIITRQVYYSDNEQLLSLDIASRLPPGRYELKLTGNDIKAVATVIAN